MISKAVMVYEDLYLKVLPTGSKVICDPPVQDTDEDYLLLVSPEQRHELETKLIEDGWSIGGSLVGQHSFELNSGEVQYFGDWHLNTEHEFLDHGSIDSRKLFHSWKRQEQLGFANGSPEDILVEHIPGSGPIINILVTCNEQYFDDFTRATFLSKALNLTNKHDRVTVFEALCMDRWPTSRKTGRHTSMLFPQSPISVSDEIPF